MNYPHTLEKDEERGLTSSCGSSWTQSNPLSPYNQLGELTVDERRVGGNFNLALSTVLTHPLNSLQQFDLIVSHSSVGI